MEFRCKEFELNHSHSTMKVGTDALLLCALLPKFDAKNILDVGTGCGIIALCMAQRYQDSDITAIDIDRESIAEAQSNFTNSKFHSHLSAIQISLQNYAQSTNKKFNLIVANPPFFENSLLSDKSNRNISRHNVRLTLEELALYSSNLLYEDGHFALILPTRETERFLLSSQEHGLFCTASHLIFDKANKPCKRIVSLLAKTQPLFPATQSSIILRNEDNTLTSDYRNLLFPFLL